MNILENGKLKVIFFRAVMIFCVFMYFIIARNSHLGIFGFLSTTALALLGTLVVGAYVGTGTPAAIPILIIGIGFVAIDELLSILGYRLDYSLFFVNLVESVEILILGLSFFYSLRSLKEIQPS